MRLVIQSAIILGLTASAAILTAPAFADVTTFSVMLDGQQQSPTLVVPGKGTAELTFDSDTKKLDWTIAYEGLSSAPAAGHIHGPAPRGENADVEIPFEGDLASPIKGSATLTDAQVEDLMAGRYYINLHTAAHKGGEIRGQIEKAK